MTSSNYIGVTHPPERCTMLMIFTIGYTVFTIVIQRQNDIISRAIVLMIFISPPALIDLLMIFISHGPMLFNHD